MRKFLLTASFCGIIGFATAQRVEVTNAILAQKDKDFISAKDYIDKAALHEKTSQEAKTWYYRGSIYQDLITSTDASNKSAAGPGGLKTAYDSYNKCKELDTKGEYASMIDKNMTGLFNAAINVGVEHYQANKFSEAVDAFSIAKTLKPKDTVGYVYSSTSAEQCKRFDVAKSDYKAMIALGHDPLDNYKYLLRIVRDVEKNDNEALEVVRMARKRYPANADMIKIELSLILKLGKTDEALANLQTAVQADPANAKMYYFNMGTLYDKAGNKEKAIESYKKALETDANYFDANYNLGVAYWNEAREFYSKVNEMDLGQYNKSGKQVEEKGHEKARVALPYFEKAYEADKTSEPVKKVLKDIYRNLKMDEKLKSIE